MGSDLFTILNQSSQSLGAHRAAAATASQNIANVNTPGYSRQTANLAAITPTDFVANTFIGSGVELQSVSQARDQFLERQLPNAYAAQGFSSTESGGLQAISALDPDDANGLTAALGAFYTALRGVAQNPSDSGLRQGAVSAAQALTRTFNRTASSLEDARNGMDARMSSIVADVNQSASAMAELNKQIQQSRVTGAEPNDLLDARQQLQDKLAALTGAVPVTDAQGDVSMALPGGADLVGALNAGKLTLAPDPANSGHFNVLLIRADGSGPVPMMASQLGGQLAGAISARDGAIFTAETGVNQMAFDFANKLNTVHAAGFDANGNPGQAMFTVSATPAGAAASLSVNANLVANPALLAAAAAPGASGDNSNMQALVNTEGAALSTGADVSTTFQNLVTAFGSKSALSKAISDQDSGMVDHLNQLRESSSGVNLDEEMVNLTKAQRAFEAVSKVITTTNSMLDTLMSLK